MDTTQTIISIATGIRGLERGIERAGIRLRPAAYVEIEAFAIANLVAAMESGSLGAAPIWTDIKSFDGAPFRGKIHGITAGYPCQPFSTSGNRAGTCDPRHIFPDILRVVEAVRPVWCFFENVEGHISMGFDEVYQGLRKVGYRVEAGLFSAVEVGAPHVRKRLFILAIDMAYATATEITELFQRNVQEYTRFRSRRAVANAYGIRRRRRHRQAPSACPTDETTPQKWQWRRDEPCNICTTLANTDSVGTRKSSYELTSTKPDKFGTKWPAGRGEKQYDWEEPRTIEPGMGCTTNGHIDRIDLLRALGNSVVEQTAALAFEFLIKKYL